MAPAGKTFQETKAAVTIVLGGERRVRPPAMLIDGWCLQRIPPLRRALRPPCKTCTKVCALHLCCVHAPIVLGARVPCVTGERSLFTVRPDYGYDAKGDEKQGEQYLIWARF